jgi:LuxR family maltose regulon positive regulatory protein
MQSIMMTTNLLTAREADVLRMLARGCTYAQISDRLGMSSHTVASHIKSIYRKLDVHSARSAVWRALQLQLLGETELAPAIAPVTSG